MQTGLLGIWGKKADPIEYYTSKFEILFAQVHTLLTGLLLALPIALALYFPLDLLGMLVIRRKSELRISSSCNSMIQLTTK